MWLPDWLYEILPFVYLIAGTVAIIQINTFIGYVVGALLLFAALMIFKMRIDYRNFKETIRLAKDLTEI